jgi:hypothetical protein
VIVAKVCHYSARLSGFPNSSKRINLRSDRFTTASSSTLTLLGVEVFGRKPDFNPQENSAGRVEFARLRKKLETYYQHEGQSDAVRISFPKGSLRSRIPLAGEWISSGGDVAKQPGRASAGTYRQESGRCLWSIRQ